MTEVKGKEAGGSHGMVRLSYKLTYMNDFALVAEMLHGTATGASMWVAGGRGRNFVWGARKPRQGVARQAAIIAGK